jgi:hypothetical protein
MLSFVYYIQMSLVQSDNIKRRPNVVLAHITCIIL